MLKVRCVAGILSAMLIAAAGVACAQDYPSKPIRISTGGVGGGSDFASRLIAHGLSGSLRQQVVVENRGGLLAVETVAKAPPDGYSLLFHGSTIWLSPLLRDNVPYDPISGFSPITLAVTAPNILVVHPSLPVRSVKELIALAKAKPGALNYSSGSTGSASHLAPELFKAMAGVNIVRIAYKSDASETADLLTGQVQLTFGAPSAQMPHIKAGKLRALAVTSAEPSALLPGTPTIAAAGIPGYESGSILGMLAPGKTPVALIVRLNQEVVRILNQPDTKEKLLSVGLEPVGSSPEEFAARIKSEMVKWGKVINDTGMKEK